MKDTHSKDLSFMTLVKITLRAVSCDKHPLALALGSTLGMPSLACTPRGKTLRSLVHSLLGRWAPSDLLSPHTPAVHQSHPEKQVGSCPRMHCELTKHSVIAHFSCDVTVSQVGVQASWYALHVNYVWRNIDRLCSEWKQFYNMFFPRVSHILVWRILGTRVTDYRWHCKVLPCMRRLLPVAAQHTACPIHSRRFQAFYIHWLSRS